MVQRIFDILEWILPFNVNFNFTPSLKEASYHIPRYTGEDAWVAAASYVPFVSAAVLLLRKNNSQFVLDHSKQALILTILALLVLMIVPSIWKLALEVVLLTLIIVSLVRAISGYKFYIPAITELSRLVEI